MLRPSKDNKGVVSGPPQQAIGPRLGHRLQTREIDGRLAIEIDPAPMHLQSAFVAAS
jgi:hypothetical protein